MQLQWIRPAKLLTRLLTDASSSSQIAWGFALGMLLGMVPKDNLTAVFLSVMLLALNVNLAAGLLGAVFFSAVGPLLDPLTHRLGYWILTYGPLEPLWTSLSQVPLFAWTRLTNTVVFGSVILGLWLLVPVWWGGYWLVEIGKPVLAEHLRRLRATQLLGGLETVARWRR